MQRSLQKDGFYDKKAWAKLIKDLVVTPARVDPKIRTLAKIVSSTGQYAIPQLARFLTKMSTTLAQQQAAPIQRRRWS